MFENELQDLRRHKWRVDTATRALFTADDARTFLHDIGFCLEYPPRTSVVAPTFIGAVIGSDQDLPTTKYAFVHPRAQEAAGLKQRLLAEKSAFEAGFGEDASLLISAAEFPYFYTLIGDRNPKQPPSPGGRGEKALLRHVYDLIEKHGPIVEKDLREKLGESASDVAVARTLHELWSKLRIVRVNEAGAWDLLLRWAPQPVGQGRQISAAEALSAIVAKYLDTCVAAEQKDVEDFFGHIVPRSKVTEVIKALLAAREFGFISISGKTLLRNVPRVSAEEKKAVRAAAAEKPKVFRKRPWQDRKEAVEPRPAKAVWRKYGPPVDKRERKQTWPRPEGDAAPRREWKPREERTDTRPPRREWKPREERTGEKPPRREWKPRQERSPDAKAPRRDWKPRKERAGADAPRRDWKKGPKRPWPKREGASAGERPAGKPFKKRGPTSAGFKKGKRPGGFGAKRGPRRPS